MRTLIDSFRAGGVEIFCFDFVNVIKMIEFIDYYWMWLFYCVMCCVLVGWLIFVLFFDDGLECIVRSSSRDLVRYLWGIINDFCVVKDFSLFYLDDIMLEFMLSEWVMFDEYWGFYCGSYEKMMRVKLKFVFVVRFDEGLCLRVMVCFWGVFLFWDCEWWKSFIVEFDGWGVCLMFGFFGIKFLLISLCIDDRYVKIYFVLLMVKVFGMFLYVFWYVRLKICICG